MTENQFLIYFWGCAVPLLILAVIITTMKVKDWFSHLFDYLHGDIPNDITIEPTEFLTRLEKKVRAIVKYKQVEIKSTRNRLGKRVYYTNPVVSRRKFYPTIEAAKKAIDRWERLQYIKDRRAL